MIPGLFLLLHFLVFVYWLGGDIGAFYAASLVSDTRLGSEARLTAARVLNTVDQGLRWSLSRAKPMVVAIWGLLLTAAALGISHVG